MVGLAWREVSKPRKHVAGPFAEILGDGPATVPHTHEPGAVKGGWNEIVYIPGEGDEAQEWTWGRVRMAISVPPPPLDQDVGADMRNMEDNNNIRLH